MQDDNYISPIKNFFRKKWVRVFLVIDCLAIIIVAVIIISNLKKNSVINLLIAPIDSQITINGDSHYSNGKYSIAPGTYEIKISHENLNPKTIIVNIDPHSSVSVATFLSKDGNLDFYELKENDKSLQILREIASFGNNITTDQDASAEDFISEYEYRLTLYDKLPILDKTPSANGIYAGVRYQYDTLTISDGRNLEQCTKALCIEIKDTSGEKENYALSVIDNLGFYHGDYQIIYQEVDYEE